jgi:hypothetical protein
MKTKLEQTFDLTQADIRAAIIAYVNAQHGTQAKDADLDLKIERGYISRYDSDEDVPPSVAATVVVKVG